MNGARKSAPFFVLECVVFEGWRKISFTACRFENKIAQLHRLHRALALKGRRQSNNNHKPPKRVRRGIDTWNG
jgi:hypothetical protein